MAAKVEILKDFYESHCGKLACQIIRSKLKKLWPSVHREKIMGYGFPQPYLPLFTETNTCATFMPASLGAMNLGKEPVLCEDDALPARLEFFDRIIAVHGIEHTESMEKVFDQFWRVLSPNGKLIIIVPNKDGFWHKSPPFDISRTYIKSHVIAHLQHAKFVVRKSSAAIHYPQKLPFGFLNSLLGLFFPSLGAVLVIEAQKVVFAPRGRSIKVTPSWIEKLFKPKVEAPEPI